MLTKQQIETCNDGQQLADWAAEYCMGWAYVNMMVETAHWVDSADKIIHLHYEWQPHQPTEKGKAQAIDLAEKYEIDVRFMDKRVLWFGNRRFNAVLFKTKSWQIAVLKAALLSEIGE